MAIAQAASRTRWATPNASGVRSPVLRHASIPAHDRSMKSALMMAIPMTRKRDRGSTLIIARPAADQEGSERGEHRRAREASSAGRTRRRRKIFVDVSPAHRGVHIRRQTVGEGSRTGLPARNECWSRRGKRPAGNLPRGGDSSNRCRNRIQGIHRAVRPDGAHGAIGGIAGADVVDDRPRMCE